MFRPLTFITLVMACGSGLYLYQVKHQAQMVDREIDHTVRAIDAARAQVRELSATWTLEGNPTRLQQLATQFLPEERPVQPSQFASLADLDTRLPAPRSPDAVPAQDGTPSGLPEAVPDTASPPDSLPIASAPAAPPPPPAHPAEPTKVAAAPPSVPPARSPDRKPPDIARPPREVAVVQPVPMPRASAPRPTLAEFDRPAPRPRVSVPPPIPVTGSVLGMAQSAAVPAPPRPLPVSTAPMAFGNQ